MYDVSNISYMYDLIQHSLIVEAFRLHQLLDIRNLVLSSLGQVTCSLENYTVFVQFGEKVKNNMNLMS